MNEHQPRRLSAVERAEARARHPSNYDETLDWQSRTIAAHLHDFFTFGTPTVLSELECYLLESGSDLLVDDVLNGLEATARTGNRAPTPEAA